MKWSQGLCTAILIDGLCGVSPPARSQPVLDGDFPGLPLASRSNALRGGLEAVPGGRQTLDPQPGKIWPGEAPAPGLLALSQQGCFPASDTALLHDPSP